MSGIKVSRLATRKTFDEYSGDAGHVSFNRLHSLMNCLSGRDQSDQKQPREESND
jgi:hypothetical protein